MKLIERDEYLSKLKNVKGTPDIKVITGIRRSGKSKLMEAYMKYINEKLPPESPTLFYLHPNAEISYLTAQGAYLFDSVLNIQGGSALAQADGQKGKGDIVTDSIKKFLGELKDRTKFDLKAIREKAGGNPTPYDIVALQECERLNDIFSTCIYSLEELEKGLKGELNVTEQMEALSGSLRFNKLPEIWQKTAGYPSKKPLSSWFTDLLERHVQLSDWVSELKCPKCEKLVCDSALNSMKKNARDAQMKF